jgi:hypothetical protein
MNSPSTRPTSFHSCDLCGAERVPSSATCGVCGAEYRAWAYLTHEQAFQLLITFDLADAYGLEYTVTNYADDRAVIAVFDVVNGAGHVGDL